MRILLIEDEKKLAQALIRGLKQHGYAVDHLENGEEAVTRLSLYRNEYDLAILDLMIPKLDGKSVCEEVRSLGVKVPILILTAKGETDDKVDLLQAGADDYMVKPFSFRELLARITALLRRPNDVMPAMLTVGDLVLDTSSHTARRGTRTLDLTLKEFMLLEYLMRHPNQTVERETILDHVWEFDFSSLSNIVDVHIKNLRKKLGPDGNDIIKTIRGVGYQLVG